MKWKLHQQPQAKVKTIKFSMILLKKETIQVYPKSDRITVIDVIKTLSYLALNLNYLAFLNLSITIVIKLSSVQRRCVYYDCWRRHINTFGKNKGKDGINQRTLASNETWHGRLQRKPVLVRRRI